MSRLRYALFALAWWGGTAWAADPVAPPTVAPGAVVAPQFTIAGKPVKQGTGFLLQVGEQTALVTAFQLLGVAAGDVPKQVTGASLVDVYTSQPTVSAGAAAFVADAAPFDQGVNRDLAVFPVSVSGFDTLGGNTRVVPSPLRLAAAAPKVGELVWLAAAVAGDPDRLHAAKVGQVDEAAMYVDFVEPIDLAGTAGAPFLNAQGQVVGMCVGGGKMPDGVVVGGANPLGALKTKVAAALGGK